MVMEYTARELGIGAPLASDAELKLKDDFLINWGMNGALEDYSAHAAETTRDIKEGDVVVWRWSPPGKAYRTGHAVIVVKILDDNRIISLEANREDDKSLEGIVFTERLLKKEGADLYILRRK